MEITEDLKVRLFSRTRTLPNGCLVWTGPRDQCGYGTIGIKGKTYKTHRVAFEIYHDRPPVDGLEINHVCGNPACLAEDCLEEVTKSENILHGLATKGRRAPLSPTRVKTISHCLDTGEYTLSEISSIFDIHATTAYGIRSGRRWSSVTGKRSINRRSVCPGGVG